MGSSEMSKNGITKIEDRAAEWALKIEDGLTESQKIELESWLEKHPDFETHLERFQKSWKRFEILNPQHFSLENLNTNRKQNANRARFSTKKWLLAFGVAATIALFGIGFAVNKTGYLNPNHNLHTFHYEEGDFYELEDGSTLDLNVGAEVVSKYSTELREFWIKSGEAYFTVAKDLDRPFDVYAGKTRLRALGTQFNVKCDDSAIEILVTEGIVSLSNSTPKKTDTVNRDTDANQPHRKLIRNQKAIVRQATYAPDGYIIEEMEEKEVSQRLLWKPVTLKFDSTPLSEVVASFNRYNENQLVIEDERIETLQIVATFRSNNMESFINLLQATSNVVAEHKENRILLFSKN